jgi:hypothetical protein
MIWLSEMCDSYEEEDILPEVRETSTALVTASSPEKSCAELTSQASSSRYVRSRFGPRKRRRQANVKLMKMKRLEERNAKLSTENRNLKMKLKNMNSKLTRLLRIETDAENKNTRASILLEQLNSYGKKWHNWSELMLRHCVIFRAKSSVSYEYARSGILHLPCPSTLRKYIGPMTMQAGMTTTIVQRLQEEFKQLSPLETYSSLIFDEMAIKASTFVRQYGQIFGQVNFGNYRRLIKHKKDMLANRLLCCVCNTSSHRRFRNDNRESYWNLEDKRLHWLKNDFIQYLNRWQLSTKKDKDGMKLAQKNASDSIVKSRRSTSYLTRDTDLAVRLTTQATVLCIR